MENKYDIPEITLRKWEAGAAKLTDKGIQRCLGAYSKEGVIATMTWVKDGIGPIPSLPGDDIEYFRSHYPGCIVFQITDDRMSPMYANGDTVIGLEHLGTTDRLHMKGCIIQLPGGSQVVALLHVSNSDIKLTFINDSPDYPPATFDANTCKIAPIIWHKIGSDL